MSVASLILSFAASLILVETFAIVLCFISFDEFINCEKSIVESYSVGYDQMFGAKKQKTQKSYTDPVHSQYCPEKTVGHCYTMRDCLIVCLYLSVCLFNQLNPDTRKAKTKYVNRIDMQLNRNHRLDATSSSCCCLCPFFGFPIFNHVVLHNIVITCRGTGR